MTLHISTTVIICGRVHEQIQGVYGVMTPPPPTNCLKLIFWENILFLFYIFYTMHIRMNTLSWNWRKKTITHFSEWYLKKKYILAFLQDFILNNVCLRMLFINCLIKYPPSQNPGSALEMCMVFGKWCHFRQRSTLMIKCQ